MTPGKLRAELIAERAAWVRTMLAGIRDLPLESMETFTADPRNAAAAESYAFRGLEGLLDLGRHVLAEGFGRTAVEYEEIADGLGEAEVLDEPSSLRLRDMAGYRNRLVHFYDQIGEAELFRICSQELTDVDATLDSILGWVARHPEKVEGSPDGSGENGG